MGKVPILAAGIANAYQKGCHGDWAQSAQALPHPPPLLFCSSRYFVSFQLHIIEVTKWTKSMKTFVDHEYYDVHVYIAEFYCMPIEDTSEDSIACFGIIASGISAPPECNNWRERDGVSPEEIITP